MAKTATAGVQIVAAADTPALFKNAKAGAHTIYRAVFRELANPRAGTASTKRRDEVSGGGKKPWKQKGTGRARQGSTRSPQWRHGGIVFGPKPRSYVTSLNKKERRAAFIAAMADRYANGVVALLDATSINSHKTADVAAALFGGRRAGDNVSATLVVFAPSEAQGAGRNLRLGGRNLPAVEVTSADALDLNQVLKAQRIILTREASSFLSALGEASNG